MEAFNLNPSNLENLIFYLLPGFLLIFLFYYQIPDRKKSDFTIVIWSVVSSSLINWGSIQLIGFINWTLSLNISLNNIFVRFFLSIFFSFVLAKLVKNSMFTRFNKHFFDIDVYPFGSLWNDFFHLPKNSTVKIFLNNGLCYIGVVKRTSVNLDDNIQEVELWKPLYFDTKKRRKTPILETKTVLIQSNSIISVELIKPEYARLLYPGL